MPTAPAKVFKADCPSRAVLEQIADKWSVLILAALCDGPMRFNALRRCLSGITQKALTHTLKRLERLGIVERTVFTGPPIAVEYQMTALGHSLETPFTALYVWTMDHLKDVEAAKRRFDQAGQRSSGTPALAQSRNVRSAAASR